MSTEDSFHALRAGLLAGDPEAAAQLFASYADRLVALARSRLGPRFRPRVDPDDVVQSSFRSFFHRCAAGQFDLPSPDQLWGLLALFTLRKCRRQVEYHQAARRDVRRESAPVGAPDATPPSADDRAPTPEEAALLADTVEQVYNRLASPIKRRVFELTLQGWSVAAIADELGYYERGVERARAEIRSLLRQLSAD